MTTVGIAGKTAYKETGYLIFLHVRSYEITGPSPQARAKARAKERLGQRLGLRRDRQRQLGQRLKG